MGQLFIVLEAILTWGAPLFTAPSIAYKTV